MPPPILNDDLCFLQRVEDLAIQKFISQLRVEALTIAILPRAAGHDVVGLGPHGREPVTQVVCNKLWAVIRADIRWDAPQDEEIRQGIDHIRWLELPTDPDRKTFSRELVNNVQHSILPPIMRTVFNKVMRPDVVGIFGTKTNAGSVVEPKTSAFGLFGKYFQPLTSPDRSYPLSIHPPALVLQHRRDPAIAIATVLDSKCCDIRGQCRLIIRSGWLLALRGAVLAENSASKPL